MNKSTLLQLELEHTGDSNTFEYSLNLVVTSEVLREKLEDYLSRSNILHELEKLCREEIENALNNIYSECDE